MTIHDEHQLTTADLASASGRTEEQSPKGLMQPPGAHALDGATEAMFSHDEVNQLRPMWISIQTKFIDEPRQSVVEADGLVASTIKRLAESPSLPTWMRHRTPGSLV
jgi:hypothetical protein